MKQAVELFPDSTLTKLALDFLYLATRLGEKDYQALRDYLDLNIDPSHIELYMKKEEIKTKCFMSEKNYPTAIHRLQLILDNPETVADSLFALIDQAYCYMMLALSGAKALPNISVSTPDFRSYLDFMKGLNLSGLSSQPQNIVKPTLAIQGNYPNPFNPSTTIRFSVPADGMVKLTIYNIKGQKVKELVNEHLRAGKHQMIWNGTGANGKHVGSGLYFARLESGGKYRINKMMMLK